MSDLYYHLKFFKLFNETHSDGQFQTFSVQKGLKLWRLDVGVNVREVPWPLNISFVIRPSSVDATGASVFDIHGVLSYSHSLINLSSTDGVSISQLAC
jgi:hypothetical protein